jgi:hypothetical protein
MIGTPPSARHIPADRGLHAADSSHRYAEPMNDHVASRMRELGIPTDRIGATKYGFPHRAFWPEEGTGGGNAPSRRLTVDSNVFNPELTADRAGAGPVWVRARLRERNRFASCDFWRISAAGPVAPVLPALRLYPANPIGQSPSGKICCGFRYVKLTIAR